MRRTYDFERRSATTGAFIVLVGPDGVGKTTLADALLRERQGRYFHFRPPFRASTMHRTPPQQDPPLTKDPGPAFAPIGWLRLARNLVSTWVGFLTAIRPTRLSGDLVVGDRWLYGYLVQPGPLRFAGPAWLARLGLAMLPAPDLVVNLAAPVDVVLTRKDELSEAEVVRELNAWRSLPVDNLVTFDGTSDVQDLVRAVLERISVS